MNEEFKEKLRNYVDGNLSTEEKEQLEQEFETIEEYKKLLEEESKSQKISFAGELPTDAAVHRSSNIIKKAKWKARLQNALAAVGIIILGTIVCSILSAIYFSSGNPDRMTVYREVTESVLAVTEPNLRLRSNSISGTPFFGAELKGELTKRIGSVEYYAGDIEVFFQFNQAGFPERKKLIDKPNFMAFSYPGSQLAPTPGGWEKLDKLPEGTVAEVYLSLDRNYSTDEILKKFSDRDMQPVWFAVDTGFDNREEQHGLERVVGFPYEPVWHYNEMTFGQQSVAKQGWLIKGVSQSASSPMLESYGSADLRNQNFLNTLNLLKDYEKMANRIAGIGDLKIKERIEYLNKNGVGIYGVVVTGPTKEILKLRNEAWIKGLNLGEVRFWNWSNPGPS
ncbi:MAG: anti-sigma factor [Syntrophomonadaceae bacterium]